MVLDRNVVAVTELIPDIFVALSPTMLPFAFILPETVAELSVPSDVILGCATVCSVPFNVVAVTLEMLCIFVAPSPIIFPFAFILLETVS